jgi:predicted Zn-dependent protease
MLRHEGAIRIVVGGVRANGGRARSGGIIVFCSLLVHSKVRSTRKEGEEGGRIMQPLSIADQRYLRAGEGWLELGSWQEAKKELDCISPQMREHPAVLCARWNALAAAQQWELAAQLARKLSELAPKLPFGWIQLAHSLHAMKRTEEARNILLPLVDKFPGQCLMRYKLACYACQLGKLDEARDWLKGVMNLADSNEIEKIALGDPDLKPLWPDIRNL